MRETWKPEHTTAKSWIEEGESPNIAEEKESDAQTQTQRQLVDQRLLLGEADKEVRTGDTVDYIDTAKEGDVMSVRITKRTTIIEQGLIAERTPLAQILLGGVAGDEVVLNVPGVPKRILRIVTIKREDK